MLGFLTVETGDSKGMWEAQRISWFGNLDDGSFRLLTFLLVEMKMFEFRATAALGVLDVKEIKFSGPVR
jgi:hypothetical protein